MSIVFALNRNLLLLSTSKIGISLFLVGHLPCRPLSGHLSLHLFRGPPTLFFPNGYLFLAIFTIRSWFIRLKHMIVPLYLFFQKPLIDVVYSTGPSDIFASVSFPLDFFIFRTIFISIVSSIFRVLEVSVLVFAA